MRSSLLACCAGVASAFSFTSLASLGRASSPSESIQPRDDAPPAVLDAQASVEPFSFVPRNVIYQPTGRESVQYSRYAQLLDGTILATVSLNGHSPAFFPVFKSIDGGVTWTWLSNISDNVNAWGLTSHPALTELTEAVGDYPEGTILASGGSTNGLYTIINVYASRDRGLTWEFVSRPAVGGPPSETNGGTSVWEPFLL